MPDCSASAISIGGRIATVEGFELLLDALSEDGAGIDWRYCDDRERLREHMLQGAAERLLFLSDNNRVCGDWSAVIEACEGLHLHYCIEDDGCVGAWAPHRVYYHPETGRTEMAGGGEEPGPTIPLARLAEWRDSGVLLERLAQFERAAALPPFEIAPAVSDAVRRTVPAERGFGPPEARSQPICSAAPPRPAIGRIGGSSDRTW